VTVARRAVFCDRDGVLIRDDGYVADARSIEILSGVPAAIRLLNRSGFLPIVVTNQSGVARGYFSEEAVKQIHATISERLAHDGARIEAFYYCPHHVEGSVQAYCVACDCRKPQPGLILRAAKAWQIDLAGSFVVGDKMTDVEAGLSVGATTVLIDPLITGEPGGNSQLNPAQKPHRVAPNLFEAVQWILELDRSTRR
jgi:D-glycero-D-manno-heptose 1,7-bisphosphate phosphatase